MMKGQIANVILIFSVVFAISSLTGCTSTSPLQLNPAKSQAYNIARAGGIYDATDDDVSQQQRENLAKLGWAATRQTFPFYSSPYNRFCRSRFLDFDRHRPFLPGRNRFFNVGIAPSCDHSKRPIERDSVFGWIPQSQAKDQKTAWTLMSKTLLSGIEKSLQQANLAYVVDSKNLHKDPFLGSAYITSSVQIIAPAHGCPADNDDTPSCLVTTTVFAPTATPQQIPDVIAPAQYGYAFSASGHVNYSRIKLDLPKGSDLNRNQLLASISQQLPAPIFIFVASKKLETQKYSVPMILTQGKAEFFITPPQK